MSDTIQLDKLEPIKGFPEFRWAGKRPLSEVRYFPAQLKESIGKPDENGWMNKIFWGDNLQVLSNLLKSYRGCIDLIYIDPPFDSNADYKKTIGVKNKNISTDNSVFEEKQYTDLWTSDEYLQFMYERLILLRELMGDKSIICLHCDWHKVHHLRCLLDEVFGSQNFVNEIIWQKIRTAKTQSASFGNIHDSLLIYSKETSFKFKKQFYQSDDEKLLRHYNKTDSNGRRYQLVSFTQDGQGDPKYFGEKGLLHPPPGKHWIWSQERIDEGLREGLIEFSENGQPKKRMYLEDVKGTAMGDIWTDIYPLNSVSLERTDYPTQKPESLLERIIDTFSVEGSLVLDCFMGSGTTQAVAAKLGRRFIGSDINLGSIETTKMRLLSINPDLNLEIFNVNNYDLFRNPVEAKDLLTEALQLNKLKNSPFDGEHDGWMHKIMPVDRIATAEDLKSLQDSIPYSKYKERAKKEPKKPVEYIRLVCMGHEPDLASKLQAAYPEFKLEVEVVDILRDKSELSFKMDSEAKIVLKKGKLVIEEFYPRNLLQKASLHEGVKDWKELVEYVSIDWNFNGSYMDQPEIDIPEKDKIVKGAYEIPQTVGRKIKVKIVDLLSESYEEVIDYAK